MSQPEPRKDGPSLRRRGSQQIGSRSTTPVPPLPTLHKYIQTNMEGASAAECERILRQMNFVSNEPEFAAKAWHVRVSHWRSVLHLLRLYQAAIERESRVFNLREELDWRLAELRSLNDMPDRRIARLPHRTVATSHRVGAAVITREQLLQSQISTLRLQMATQSEEITAIALQQDTVEEKLLSAEREKIT
nr:hypothetical protein CFP56_03772 [Quercus suber]